MSTEKEDWYKLDNAAKIFPVVLSKSNAATFRVGIRLNEEVDPETLQKAIDLILPRFPMFKVKLKHGLFWYYLDYNNKKFVIKPQTDEFCGHIKDNNDYLFEVQYRGSTITILMFHGLTDGTGGFVLLKSLVYEYLLLKGYNVKPDNMITTRQSPLTAAEYEESYLKFYDKNNRTAEKEEKAFEITGDSLTFGGIGAVLGWLKTSEIHALAKASDVTITGYITAVFMYAIYKTRIKGRAQLKDCKKPVKILIPVNLRKYLPSVTLRNFSGFIKTNMMMNREDISFEEILQLVKKQMADQMGIRTFTKQFNSYVFLEKNFLLRLCPLFLKKFIMKLAYTFVGESLNTTQFSNVGIIDFPESMQSYIKSAEVSMGASKTGRLNLMACSYLDSFNITFSRSIAEHDIEREFFRFLTSKGLSVTIESNYMEEQNEIL